MKHANAGSARHGLPVLALALLLPGLSGPVAAASRDFTASCRTRIVCGGDSRSEMRSHTYRFTIEVISDQTGPMRETWQGGKPRIWVNPGERYTVRLHNPMPVRVAVNLTLDGLSSITGKPVAPASGSKWIVEPHSWIDIAGWQVSGQTARRFFFTSKRESYAAWAGNRWGRDLAVNCGVIGAAYFWSRSDLESHFDRHPLIEYPAPGAVCPQDLALESKAGLAACRKRESAPTAGTGMGERQCHPVTTVEFHPDMGMYQPSQVVAVFYDFAGKRPEPRPFPGDFAVEMP